MVKSAQAPPPPGHVTVTEPLPGGAPDSMVHVHSSQPPASATRLPSDDDQGMPIGPAWVSVQVLPGTVRAATTAFTPGAPSCTAKIFTLSTGGSGSVEGGGGGGGKGCGPPPFLTTTRIPARPNIHRNCASSSSMPMQPWLVSTFPKTLVGCQ